MAQASLRSPRALPCFTVWRTGFFTMLGMSSPLSEDRAGGGLLCPEIARWSLGA